MEKNKQKLARSTWIGWIIGLISPILVILLGLVNVIDGGVVNMGGVDVVYGVRGTLSTFWKVWSPSVYPFVWGFIAVFIEVLAVAMFIFDLILIAKKKQGLLVLNAIVRLVSHGFLAFILLLVAGICYARAMNTLGLIMLVLALVFDVCCSYLEFMPICSAYRDDLAKAVYGLSKEGEPEEKEEDEPVFGEEDARRVAKEEIAAAKEEEKPISEEAIGAIAEEKANAAIKAHVDEMHKDNDRRAPVTIIMNAPAAQEEPKKEEPKPEPEPVEEEPKEEEKPAEEEPKEEAEPEEAAAIEEAPAEEVPAGPDDPFAGLGNRRRASFETKLKNSDEDLRHKYYELRDYIASYGVKPRISKPGVTFSAHRERYVFVTIVGKHIKANFALDPNSYKNSTIPATANESKKYEDVPCEIKVKSDLSLKRAKLLVDDVMAKKGVAKPEAPADAKAAK